MIGIDFETTPDFKNKINVPIEIGLYNIDNHETYNSLIHTKIKLGKWQRENLTHIQDDILQISPTSLQVCQEILEYFNRQLEFCGTIILVAHDGKNSDFPIFKKMFKDNQIELPHIVYVDTLVLVKQIENRNFKATCRASFKYLLSK